MTVWGVALMLLLTACHSTPPSPYGSPATDDDRVPMLAPNAGPQIRHLSFPNGLVVKPGAKSEFSGTITTSSNVASVEIRTNLFSINAKKKDVGRFAFDVDVYDLPGIFIRAYTLRVIARNATGVEAEEDVPFRIARP